MLKSPILALSVATVALAPISGATPAGAPARATPPGHTLGLRAGAAAPAPPGTTARPGDAPGPGCGFTKAVPYDRFKGLPDFTAGRAARPYIARLYTTQGVIAFRALTTAAPCTTFSFRFLAQRLYFDQTHCHRLTTQGIFVLQCGDPTGTGAGGPGYRFNDENLAGATYPAATVAMANSGPNTNGSQFFLVYKDTDLSASYTPFGKIVSGLGIIQQIAKAGTDNSNGPGDGHPKEKVEIESVTIKKT